MADFPRVPFYYAEGGASIDKPLVFLVMALVSIGFVMMVSASVEFAAQKQGAPLYYAYKQFFYLLLALGSSAILFVVPMKVWQRFDWLLLLVGMILLVLVVTPLGKEVGGSRRWLPLGPMNLQSSELAKFCVLIYFAGYLVRRQDEVRNHWKGLIKPIMVLSIMIVLLLKEPDFGAVVVMVAACLGMIFLGGVKLSQFLVLIVVSAVAVVCMAISAPYRMERLKCFINPWEQQFDCGYQLTQSLIAFGRGEWFGTGLGNSVQKLFYLPEAHTDFVFAILAEELGLVGSLVVIALFVLLVGRIMIIGRESEVLGQHFSAYVAYGVGIIFSTQVFINIGVNAGLLPTKGLTLPFVSYGGTSLILCFWLMVLLLRIGFENQCRHATILNKGASTKATKDSGGGYDR